MKLTQARYEAFARLGSEVDSRIDGACNLYNSLLKEADIPLTDERIWHNGQIWLEDLRGGVDISWETSWRYGGHDSGTNVIPMECLLDDTWEEEVTKRADEVIAKFYEDEFAKEKRHNHEERKEFNRLKAIFEGDDR